VGPSKIYNMRLKWSWLTSAQLLWDQLFKRQTQTC